MRTRVALLATTLAAAGAAGTATPAEAKTPAPKLTAVRCVPKTSARCKAGVHVAVGKQVQLSGTQFKRKMRVSFRWSRGALATKLTFTRAGWIVRVPPGVAPGKVAVYLTDRAGRRSNQRSITVVSNDPVPVKTTTQAGDLPAAFAGDGMWIWELPKSEGGNLDAIASRAKAAGMGTVFVKSADGTTVWSQFTAALVAGLHQRGLRACAWQYVYGSDPVGEAAAAAASVRAGADCFVIDAESQYEGRYAAAQKYMTALRAAIGPAYPLGLTSFPYVDYHPRLPYSVFLGPGGAQANLPQVYWKDIGGTVDAVSAKTVANNRIYGAALAPLGQTYGSVSGTDVRRFRALWAGYGAGGLSWWSWQATPGTIWPVLTEARQPTIAPPDPGWPALDSDTTGDQVIWLQMHLATAVPTVPVNGKFGASTLAGLKAFQQARGLPVTGETDAATWQELLKLQAQPADWT